MLFPVVLGGCYVEVFLPALVLHVAIVSQVPDDLGRLINAEPPQSYHFEGRLCVSVGRNGGPQAVKDIVASTRHFQ